MRRAALAALALVAATALRAEAPETSPAPVDRPAEAAAAPAPGTMPEPRPDPVRAICDDPAIRGTRLRSIPGAVDGCGIDAPVEVTSVAGLTLSQPATIDCPTASALRKWATRTVIPALERTGGGVTGLRVAAHYACRTRNHKPGAKISEHGKGHAIDISAFRTADGSEITVLDGWRDDRDGDILKRIYGGACGIFGTVLGPESDAFHQDHFHLDTARYRSGSYCR